MMNSTRVRTLAVCILLLSACECEESDAAVRYSVGGTVTGLSGSGLVLRNGGDELEIGEDGPFVFPATLADGQAYAVTVHAQPSAPSQTCAVDGGTGEIAGADVTDVTVTCVTDGVTQRFAVGGTVTGLSGTGLVLRNGDEDEIAIEDDGPFVFPTTVEDGEPYRVTVHAQPSAPSQTCAVEGGEGTVSGADVMDVAVTCVTDRFTVGGTVSGLSGSGLVLRHDGGDEVAVEEDGPFAFPTPLEDGSAFAVTVHAQPADPSQFCEVTGGSGEGVVSGADVTTITVACGPYFAILEFSASRSVVSAGDDVVLSWSTRGATDCEIAPGDLTATPGALESLSVEVHATTSFTLSCTGPAGSGTRDLAILVTDEDWADVSAGAHSCGVKRDGQLYCWGGGGDGQLGDGEEAASPVPVQEASLGVDWVQVSAGATHTCAVTGDGRLFCWGRGLAGQLGTGQAQSAGPVEVARQEDGDWRQVSAGWLHTCAVKVDGRLFCWGSGEHGRLGRGSNVSSSTPRQESTRAEDWAQVTAGYEHSCALKTDGTLYCWGNGGDGRLGNFSTTNRSSPVQEYSEAENWTQVTAGHQHTCAVKTDGRLFCWGANDVRQLGIGTQGGSWIPVQEASGGEDWAQAAAGWRHTCAVKEDGRLFCWGYNRYGQVGNDTADTEPLPTEEITEAGDWARVSAGNGHTCGMTQDGRIRCWGANDTGQLGNGQTVEVTSAVQESSATTDWIQIAAGPSRSCALRADHRVFCWGPFRSTWPRFVPIQEPSEADDWAQISAGLSYFCGVKQDARLLCWGAGSNGRLGHGSSSNTDVPTQESTEAEDWAHVSAGWQHACAVKTDGRLYCWGLGTSGQLGDGDGETREYPVQEQTESQDWAHVSAGLYHTCAVKTDGRLFCWGEGEDGQLGNDDTEPQASPVQEDSEAEDWAQVSAGYSHTCALKTDGRLFCWGRGAFGQLGNDDTENSHVPVQVHGEGDGWVEVAAGASHTCAVRKDGRLLCWGRGSLGRLGTGDVEDRGVPTPEVTASENWSRVAGGTNHTVALKADGRIFGWGADLDGQLGIGRRPAPVWPTD